VFVVVTQVFLDAASPSTASLGEGLEIGCEVLDPVPHRVECLVDVSRIEVDRDSVVRISAVEYSVSKRQLYGESGEER
jgi:hypothetical protein